MMLLMALLSAWPIEWYTEYASMDWQQMSAVSEGYQNEAGLLSAKAISLFCTGEGDPLSVAREALEKDSSDYRAWTALAMAEMCPDSQLMDSIFTRAFALCPGPGDDIVLREIYGYWLLTMGNFQGAVEQASLAVSADSSFAPAWLTLSMAYMDWGRIQDALEASSRSLERQPSCIPLIYQNASVLEAAGLLEEAVSEYERVIAMDSMKVSAYADLSMLYADADMVGEAVKTLRSLLEVAPSYGWGWGELASLEYDMGRTDLADSFFTKAVELDPSDSWSLYRLGRLRSSTYPEEAEGLLQRAVAISPDYSEAWQELVFVYETLDDLPSAEAALEKCIELTPQAWLFGELGYVRENMGLMELAAEAFQRSVELDAQYLYGWQRRGEAFVTAGDTLAACSWFRLALDSLETEDSWITFRMGELMAGREMPDSATFYFRRTVELDPEDHLAWLNLARSEAFSGNGELALALLDSSLVLSGDTVSILADRSVILEDLGRIDQASDAAAELLESRPDGWIQAGWAALESGFRKRAAAFAFKALESPPEDPWQLISLGELFGELGIDRSMEECYRLAAVSPLRTADQTVSIANYYFRLERYGESITLLLDEYSSSPWNQSLATALAEAYLFDNQLDRAEEILLEVVEQDPMSVYSICYLGLIQENRGNPDLAAERYLEALRLEPGYRYAEDRLRFISSESYDPGHRRNQNRIIDWSLWLNLSSTGGNLDEQYYGGGGNLTFNYGRGSSVELETSGTVEIKDGRDLRRTAWAALSAEHFLSANLYGGASTSWDRQPLTVRPWQVSSYLAAGWKSWPANWIWVAPETGAGLVNTRWSISRERTDQWTVYGSLSVWAKADVDWLPSLWISGSVYLPPEKPEDLVASGVGELEFQLPGPLSLISGVSLDYTRTPVVESWENLDSEIYLRLRL